MSAPKLACLVALLGFAVPANADYSNRIDEQWDVGGSTGTCTARGPQIEISTQIAGDTRFAWGLVATAPDESVPGTTAIAYNLGVGSSEYPYFTLTKVNRIGGRVVPALPYWFDTRTNIILQGKVPESDVLAELQRRPMLMAAPTGQSRATMAMEIPPAVTAAMQECLSQQTVPNQPVRLRGSLDPVTIFSAPRIELPSGTRFRPSSYDLTISPGGHVVGCSVRVSTGRPNADIALCGAIGSSRLRFDPATDGQGIPQEASYQMDLPAFSTAP